MDYMHKHTLRHVSVSGHRCAFRVSGARCAAYSMHTCLLKAARMDAGRCVGAPALRSFKPQFPAMASLPGHPCPLQHPCRSPHPGGKTPLCESVSRDVYAHPHTGGSRLFPCWRCVSMERGETPCRRGWLADFSGAQHDRARGSGGEPSPSRRTSPFTRPLKRDVSVYLLPQALATHGRYLPLAFTFGEAELSAQRPEKLLLCSGRFRSGFRPRERTLTPACLGLQASDLRIGLDPISRFVCDPVGNLRPQARDLAQLAGAGGFDPPAHRISDCLSRLCIVDPNNLILRDRAARRASFLRAAPFVFSKTSQFASKTRGGLKC
jgi:hypothetical protein